MTPHLAPALPVAFTPRPPRGRVPASPQTVWPLLPRNTARQLYQQLRGHGVTGMYAFALPQLAVVSLPTLTYLDHQPHPDLDPGGPEDHLACW
jgi:hypothetical protein